MQINLPQADAVDSIQSEVLKDNEFRVNEVPPASALLVGDAAVFNVAGQFCATQAKCPHKQGP
jgi:nitrite reductase/ring-hydroxylating ferredoxin subunit